MKLEDIVKGIEPLDQEWIKKAGERTAKLVMPTRALGRLHDISERLCAIQKTMLPSLNRKAILVNVSDNGGYNGTKNSRCRSDQISKVHFVG